MSTKGFISLLVGVLVLGAVFAGAFVGGMLVGKNQEAEAAQNVVPAPQPPSVQAQPAGQSDGGALSRLREQFRSGDLSREELAELRQQFQGRAGPGGGGSGIGDRAGVAGQRGLTGIIDKVDGNTVTVDTPQGPLQAMLSADTTIQKTVQVEIGELTVGTRVTISGARGEDGTFQAASGLPGT